MRKDYFSRILAIHVETRSADESSFCELHGLTSSKDNHNSIFCNLADWDDSFTGLLEILASREVSIAGKNDFEYIKFLKIAIPNYFFWMNILQDNLIQSFNHTQTILKEKNHKINISDYDPNELMPKLREIRAWTNFQKHPGYALKIHHPRISICSGIENKKETDIDQYIFNGKSAEKYFKNRSSNKDELNNLTQSKTKWLINYPDLFELHKELISQLASYLSKLKIQLTQDPEYKNSFHDLYSIAWDQIQDNTNEMENSH